MGRRLDNGIVQEREKGGALDCTPQRLIDPPAKAHTQILKRLTRELPVELKPQAAPGVLERVLEMIDSPRQVLNAGAGRGGLSSLLHQAGVAVTSIDLHPEHFQAGNLSCTFADLLEPLPFETGSFDLVLGIEVMEHLENPWLFLREAMRVLRTGGEFIFSSPNVGSLPSRLCFLMTGQLPYFRLQSFVGCYHVTPIFRWSVERACMTESASLEEVRYSRVEWPRSNDVPRHYTGILRRATLRCLPCNSLFGEVSVCRIRKTKRSPAVRKGCHST